MILHPKGIGGGGGGGGGSAPGREAWGPDTFLVVLQKKPQAKAAAGRE